MSEAVPSQNKFVSTQPRLDGILYPPMVSAEAHEKAKTIATRPDDIILACYPKSGTHWMLKILKLLLNDGDDKYINYIPEIYKDYYWLQLGAVEGKQQSYTHTPYSYTVYQTMYISHSVWYIHTVQVSMALPHKTISVFIFNRHPWRSI